MKSGNYRSNFISRRSNSQDSAFKEPFPFDSSNLFSLKRSVSTPANSLFLIIDLDNTLICSSNKPFSLSDFVFTLNDSDIYETFYVLKRPFLDTFLSNLAKYAILYLYTTATRNYTNQILSKIDPMRSYFKQVFCRENCIKENGNYIKDISKCKTDLAKTIIIDNNPKAYGTVEKHPNLLQISPFYGTEDDGELSKILPMIKEFSTVEDVRLSINNRETF